MRRFLILAAFAALAGCGTANGEGDALVGAAGYRTSANQVTLADGQQAWLVSCNGWANSSGACMQRANAICPRGVRLLESEPAQIIVQCLSQ